MAAKKTIYSTFTVDEGIGVTWTGVANGKFGVVFASATTFVYQGNVTAKSAGAVLTAAEALSKLINYSGAAATVSMPTAATLDAGVPAGMAVHDSFQLSVINTGSDTVTLGPNTGVTLVGGTTVAVGASGLWLVRRTAASGSWAVYRIS